MPPFADPRPRRRPNLTPMIDVVFLLLVFFMLVSRFGAEQGLRLAIGGTGGDWQGPPRLVEVSAVGVTLNGVGVTDLPAALAPLMPDPLAPVVLRAADGVPLQAVVTVMQQLQAVGITRLVLVE